jgi:arylesterase / paraoxonase
VDPNPKGQLVLMDYKKSPPTAEILSLGIPETSDFHPLGAALYHSSRHSTLFVTNAGRNGSSIELFHVSHSIPLKITWERSISHPLIPNANAILPVSSTEFYVTNDHLFRRDQAKSAHILESYLQLPLSYTTFVEISENVVVRKAVSSQRVANGIASTPDFETVFIAESARGGFGVYSRTSENDLKFQEFVRINGFTDNLHFNDDGYIDKNNWGKSSVIVGVHPNILRLEKFARNIRSAPSWVVSVRPATDEYQEDPHDQGLYKAKNYKNMWHVQTEFQDDGEWFGAATGAIVDNERGVMIGSGLYDSKGVFICRKR